MLNATRRVRTVKYVVNLSADERTTLQQLVRSGRTPARRLVRARVLLKADEGLSDAAVAAAVNVGVATVHWIRQRCVEEGLDAALGERPRSGAPALLSATPKPTSSPVACSTPPEERHRWTLRLLADRVVELKLAEHCSYETVRRVLKKNSLKPWQKQAWCIPTVGAAFVASMEDVLELYAEPYDAAYPVVCFNEVPVQLIGETRTPLPMRPGTPMRIDYEYVRHGTCNVFAVVEPVRGWRHLTVTAHRANADFAAQMRWLVDDGYPSALRIRVVLDNLSTHKPAALYETYPPAEARRIVRQLEFHYTPTHGSWLNMAELELSVLAPAMSGSADPDARATGRHPRQLRSPAQRRARHDHLAVHQRESSP